MNQPKDAFNQVKSILGKLDRSITEARSKRLGEALETETDEPGHIAPDSTPEQATGESLKNGTPPQASPPAGYARLRGQFGRAKAVKPETDFSSS